MKKILYVLCVLLLAIVIVGCTRYMQKSVASTPNSNAIAPTTIYDSLSYAIGIDFGTYVHTVHKGLNTGLNLEILIQGLRDVFNEQQAITPEQGGEFIENFYKVFLPAQNLKDSEEYLSTVTKNSNIGATESGLLYEIIELGDMDIRVTNDTDSIRVSYVGKFNDETELDSNDDVTFRVDRTIKGWIEGIKLIGKGGRIKLIIPPDLAYGARGVSNEVGPNIVLLFDIQLLDVIHAIESNSFYDEE